MLHYRKDLIFKSIIISVILWARLVTKIMTMLYKHNIWSNFLKIWLYTTRLIDSFLPTLLWFTYSFFPLKTHFIMQMEKNWKTLCLREKAAFCRGTHAPVPALSPHPAAVGCQVRDLVIRVGRCGVLEFWLPFPLWLTLISLSNFSPSNSQHASSSCIVAPALLPRGQAASLETVLCILANC